MEWKIFLFFPSSWIENLILGKKKIYISKSFPRGKKISKLAHLVLLLVYLVLWIRIPTKRIGGFPRVCKKYQPEMENSGKKSFCPDIGEELVGKIVRISPSEPFPNWKTLCGFPILVSRLGTQILFAGIVHGSRIGCQNGGANSDFLHSSGFWSVGLERKKRKKELLFCQISGKICVFCQISGKICVLSSVVHSGWNCAWIENWLPKWG